MKEADRISVAVILESVSTDSDGHHDRLTIYQNPLCEDKIRVFCHTQLLGIVDTVGYVNDLIKTGDWEVVSLG